jgi:hypothetical protein
MKKVISFSLWGNNKIYTIGAIKNAENALYMYPNFECWFYIHQETVPTEIIDKLRLLPNTNIIFKKGNLSTCKPRMWRFEAIDDVNVEVMMCRDTDTRILLREKLAVYEWLKSDKLFHIMRDHPHHNYLILGGMFGTKKIPTIPSWSNLINLYVQTSDRMYDQDFLRDYVYEHIKSSVLIHSSFNKYESECLPFPIPYDNELKFVGEYVYDNETCSQSHKNDLINELVTNKINLITSFYIINKTDEKIIQRNNELLECLYRNLNNDLIEKIHLYVDDLISLNKAIQMDKYNKIIIVNIGQPTYYDMFKYSIDNLKNSICMISNSDIYLYKCDLNILNQLENNIFALSRHEHNLKCEVLGWGSHDAFIFKPYYLNYNILQYMHHKQNVAGSDDNIINILCDSGFKLYNPCFEIMIIHLHYSNYRTYDSDNKISNGKYFIKQEYFNKNKYIDNNISSNSDTNSDDDFIFYHGLDHIDNDIYVKQMCSINQLKEICKADINCVGFNTLGFFKNKIDVLNLKESYWINKNTKHGIFVKKNIL